MRVLIADDCAGRGKSLDDRLRQQGYRTVRARGRRSALRLLRAGTADLALVWHALDGLEGPRLIAAVAGAGRLAAVLFADLEDLATALPGVCASLRGAAGPARGVLLCFYGDGPPPRPPRLRCAAAGTGWRGRRQRLSRLPHARRDPCTALLP